MGWKGDKDTNTMKVLFLTRDYTKRASAYTLYFPFWEALRKEGVRIWERDTLTPYGHSYDYDVLQGKEFEFEKFNTDWLNTFDWIVIENFFPFWFEDWNKITCKKALICEDLHGFFPDYLRKIQEKIDIDAFFTRYYYPFVNNILGKKFPVVPVFWLPHIADPKIFFPRSQQFEVLFTGTTGGCYELRDRIVDALAPKPYFRKTERKPNYKMAWPYGYDYAGLVGEAKISFATGSTYNYMVGKYFEIIASGTLLIANKLPEMLAAGFKEDINYVEIDWNISKNEIVDTVEYYLKNDNEREQIAHAGLKLAAKHTPEIRAKQLMENLNVTDSYNRVK